MLIFIIGAPRTGKTTLAERLSRERDMAVVHADQFIGLARPEQSRALAGAIRSKLAESGSCIAEGVGVARILPTRDHGTNAPAPDEVIHCRGPSERRPQFVGMATWINAFAEVYKSEHPDRYRTHSARADRGEAAERTRRLLQIRRELGLTNRRRRIPKALPSKTIEREYIRRLTGFVDTTEGLMAELFGELPGLLTRSADEHDAIMRVDAGEGDRIRQILEAVRARLASAMSLGGMRGLAGFFARRTERWGSDQVRKQIKAGLGVDILLPESQTAILTQKFVERNVALIKGVPERLVVDVERTIMEGLAGGVRHGEVAKQLGGLLDKSKEKAKALAQRQINQLNSQVIQARQTSLGIEEFIWHDVGDKLVRPSHRQNNGNKFSWASPPNGETPGNAPGWFPCRCWAEPVLDKLLR